MYRGYDRELARIDELSEDGAAGRKTGGRQSGIRLGDFLDEFVIL